MAKTDKSASVAELTDAFRTSSATVLTEYRGLTVAQLKSLRRTLGPTTTYAVVKNTLSKIAARDAGVAGVEDLLAGPSAIAFVKGDPVEAAKGLRDFAKLNPLLIIKGGFMEGRLLSAEEVAKLADLESREVLLAKFAGAMKASLSQAVSLFAAPLSQTARALDALRVKLEAESGPVQTEVQAEVEAPAEVEAGVEAPAEVAAPAIDETPESAAQEPAAITPEAESATESTEG